MRKALLESFGHSFLYAVMPGQDLTRDCIRTQIPLLTACLQTILGSPRSQLLLVSSSSSTCDCEKVLCVCH